MLIFLRRGFHRPYHFRISKDPGRQAVGVKRAKMSRRPSGQFDRGSWNRFSLCCSSSRAADWSEFRLAYGIEVVKGRQCEQTQLALLPFRRAETERRVGCRVSRGSLSLQAALKDSASSRLRAHGCQSLHKPIVAQVFLQALFFLFAPRTTALRDAEAFASS